MSKKALSKNQFIYHSLWTLKILITQCVIKHSVLLLIYYVFYMLFI